MVESSGARPKLGIVKKMRKFGLCAVEKFPYAPGEKERVHKNVI